MKNRVQGPGSRVQINKPFSFQLVLAAASAGLLILSFPNFNLEYLAWIGLIPLFFALENQKPLKAFLIAYLTGALFFLGTIWWLIHVTLPGMIIVVLYLALYFGIFGLLLSRVLNPVLCTLYPVPCTLFYIPAAWVATEWLRSTVLTGFGWNLLGYSQSRALPVIQIADITGVYGVSFLIVAVNCAVYSILKNYTRKKFIAPLAMATLLVYLSLAYGYYRLNNIFTGEILRVAVIQGNIPQAKKWDADFREEILNKYEALTRQAARDGVDLIIWPETAVPGYLDTERDLSDRISSLAKGLETPVLLGAPRADRASKGVYYNSAFLVDKTGEIIQLYDKLHLVPFGEYIPLKSAFSFVEKFAPMPIGDFTKGRDYTVFRFPIERSVKYNDSSRRLVKRVPFSCLICFEDIFGDLARRFVRAGAVFLVNMTNDAWFHKTSAAYQHAQCSVFRAVENRTSVIRAANTGLSCFIDQKGSVSGRVEKGGTDLFVEGYSIQRIVLARTATLYSRYGDIFAYLCVIFLIIHACLGGLSRV